MKIKLESKFILELFEEVNQELKNRNVIGELYLVGGAVMCLQFNARPSTYDIDAYFVPVAQMREAVKKISKKFDLDESWINDAVKGYLSKEGDFSTFIDKSNLKIFCATPEYILAMKCLSMRLGAQFQDESDIRFLLRYLNISKLQEVIQIIEKYYDKSQIPQKTFYALEEMLKRE